MTKAEIINEIASKTGIEKMQVATILESFMKSVKTRMAAGENIYLRGFGTFVVKKRARKLARNISKNTTVIIPEHFIPTFKASKNFADKVKSVKTDK